MRILILSTDHRLALVGNEWKAKSHDVETISIAADTLSIENIRDLEKRIRENRPDFCMIKNYEALDESSSYGNIIENILSERNIPVLSWYLDHPQFTGSLNLQGRLSAGSFPKNILFGCTSRSHQNFFQNKNLRTTYAPPAVDSKLKDYVLKEMTTEWKADLSFAGKPLFSLLPRESTSASTQDLRNSFELKFLHEIYSVLQMAPLQKNPEEAAAIVVQIAPKLTTFYQNWFASEAAFLLAKNSLYSQFRENLAQDIASLLDLISGRLDMFYSQYQITSCLQTLLHENLKIFGGEIWKSFLDGYGSASEEYHSDQLIQILAASKVTICSTKLQPLYEMRERPFLAYAANSFPLVDLSDDLSEWFSKDEVVSFETPEQARTLCQYYLKNDAERKAVIERGRARVFADHTYENRAYSLMKAVQENFEC